MCTCLMAIIFRAAALGDVDRSLALWRSKQLGDDFGWNGRMDDRTICLGLEISRLHREKRGFSLSKPVLLASKLLVPEPTLESREELLGQLASVCKATVHEKALHDELIAQLLPGAHVYPSPSAFPRTRAKCPVNRQQCWLSTQH